MLGSEVKLKVKMKFRKQLSPRMMYVKRALIYCQLAFRIYFNERYCTKRRVVFILLSIFSRNENLDIGFIGLETINFN